MTSVILDMRNIGDTRKKFTSLFRTNQEVSVRYNSNTITVTSEQNGSTPGILTIYYWLEPKTTYELIILGTTTTDVVLWAYDYTHGEMLSDDTVKLGNTSSAVNMFITNRYETKIKVRFGLLFEKPAAMGDTFDLESIALVKREGVVNGLWRRFEHGNLLITDKYSSSESKWIPTLTYVNNNT